MTKLGNVHTGFLHAGIILPTLEDQIIQPAVVASIQIHGICDYIISPYDIRGWTLSNDSFDAIQHFVDISQRWR